MSDLQSSPIPPSSWTILMDEIQLDDDSRIGGRKITKGLWKNRLVMVKVLSKQADSNELQVRAELWTSLRHPNVLQTFGVSPLNVDPLCIVTQFQPNGNVSQFLTAHPDEDRAKIVTDVALGMQYLHGRGVIHGSLKPSNILIGVDGKACTSDYGMMEVHTSESYGHKYFSPEAWKGTLSRPSDVFSWAMSALEIFTSKPPWGILSEKQIFRLVVRQDSRPERPDEDFGLTDHMWGIMERCWVRDTRQRPNFDTICQLVLGNVKIQSPTVTGERRGSTLSSPRFEALINDAVDEQQTTANLKFASIPRPSTRTTRDSSDSGSRSGSWHSRAVSMMTVPPAYEANAPTDFDAPIHSTSAPPSVLQFRIANPTPASRGLMAVQMPVFHAPNPGGPIGRDNDDGTKKEEGHVNAHFRPRDFSRSSGQPALQSAPSPSIRTLSSLGGSSTTSSGASSHFAPSRLRSIREEPLGPRSLLTTPPPIPSVYPQEKSFAFTPAMTMTSVSESSESASTAVTSPNASAAELASVCSEPSTVSTTAGPNANLLAGSLLSEVKESRNAEVVDALIFEIYKLGLRSEKDVQQLVTAGTVQTLIVLLKARSVKGIGLDKVLIALGSLTQDHITANMLNRTGTATTLIQILEAAQTETVAALAAWRLARICRNLEIANALLKQNLARLLVAKGLKGGQLAARMAAWCLGTLVRSDNIAELLTEVGFATVLCDHLRHTAALSIVSADDHCPALYAVARISRSIKIAKALAKAGCIQVITQLMVSSEDPGVLRWSAHAVGCLMRPNSSDMAKALLDADVARGLARIPSVLAPEELKPLGSLAFAVQRFSCAEWGGGTRKALVDAGVVDSLLAALRTAAAEPYPQVQIELAHAIALLSDVGGTSIRKEIVNAGGIEIMKEVGSSSTRVDVQKACSLAVTSVTGNVWSRNAASAKAALVHEWSGGCPDYYPDFPVDLNEF